MNKPIATRGDVLQPWRCYRCGFGGEIRLPASASSSEAWDTILERHSLASEGTCDSTADLRTDRPRAV